MSKSVLSIIVLSFLFLTASYAEVSKSFKKSLLSEHNVLRKKHSAPPMKWNNDIRKYAQEWAEKNAKANRMFHRKTHKYGENIYWISRGAPSGKSVVRAWYSEIKDYHFSKPGFSYKTGHFTQVVWKSSVELGCGSAKSRSGGLFVVCNYSPPGNYMRRFRKNVLRAK